MTMHGTMSPQLEAVLRLRFRGPAGVAGAVDAVVDTGFSGFVTLPVAVIAGFGLPRLSGGQATLADGSMRRFDTFTAELEWGGVWRVVVVWALGDEPLVGMLLLADCELRMQVRDGGDVTVEPL